LNRKRLATATITFNLLCAAFRDVAQPRAGASSPAEASVTRAELGGRI